MSEEFLTTVRDTCGVIVMTIVIFVIEFQVVVANSLELDFSRPFRLKGVALI
jgi:hypothetical protein